MDLLSNLTTFATWGLIISIIIGVLIFKVPPFLDRQNLFNERGVIPLFHREEPWGFQVHQIPDLSGKIVVVTGANSGLGYWTAYHLANKNAMIVMAVRDENKGNDARSRILADIPNAKIDIMKLDLADLESVKNFAESYLQSYDSLHSLILNAGVLDPPFTLSKQGLELQFAVNHLGHFYLTTLLLEILKASKPATVSVVSSSSHYRATELLNNTQLLNDKVKYGEKKFPAGHYAHSKLCNIYFMQELARKMEGTGVLVNAVYPGLVSSSIARHFMSEADIERAGKMYLWHPRDAALTQIYTSLSKEIFEQNTSGKYFHPIARVQVPSMLSQDEENQKALWKWSLELITKFEAGEL